MKIATRKLAYLPGFVCTVFLLFISACTHNVIVEPPLDSDGDGIIDQLDTCPHSSAGTIATTDGCPRDTDGDGVPDYLDKCPNTPPGAAACAFGCELTDPIVINLVNDEFDFDSSELKQAMKTRLDALIQQLGDNPDLVELTVVGHTDSIGTEEYNQTLSLSRAQSVMDYLQTNGLNDRKFSRLGKGELQPIAENSTETGRSHNRRVEIYTHSPEQHCCSLLDGEVEHVARFITYFSDAPELRSWKG